MSIKKDARIRRGKKTRHRIKVQAGTPRLCVNKTPQHMYAQIIVQRENGCEILASASTIAKDIRDKLKGTKTERAQAIGKLIAEKAKKAGINKIAFDRSGFKYHGRVKALADAAREAGLDF